MASSSSPSKTGSNILNQLTATTTSRTVSPQLSIAPITTPAHLASLKRLNSLLLPVNYPELFYHEILTDADAAAVSRLSWWSHICVGGIRGKVEDIDSEGRSSGGSEAEGGKRKVRVYIMTLGVLSPFRGVGVGGKLMEWLLNGGDGRGKDGREWEVVEVYAHVWEANDEALEWYRRRGFVVGEDVVHGYYRKLRPNGAKVVRWRKGQ
ncbi:hypothetical protein BGX38DRAFT_517758 [Terfezia claveryi]|nr:hypothetical protein BGX38DRAFT_517758 [Terfezia claveryi]